MSELLVLLGNNSSLAAASAPLTTSEAQEFVGRLTQQCIELARSNKAEAGYRPYDGGACASFGVKARNFSGPSVFRCACYPTGERGVGLQWGLPGLTTLAGSDERRAALVTCLHRAISSLCGRDLPLRGEAHSSLAEFPRGDARDKLIAAVRTFCEGAAELT